MTFYYRAGHSGVDWGVYFAVIAALDPGRHITVHKAAAETRAGRRGKPDRTGGDTQVALR